MNGSAELRGGYVAPPPHTAPQVPRVSHVPNFAPKGARVVAVKWPARARRAMRVHGRRGA